MKYKIGMLVTKAREKKQELKRKKKHISCHEYGIFDIVQGWHNDSLKYKATAPVGWECDATTLVSWKGRPPQLAQRTEH